ncbi:MAG: hypothetical protein EA363_00735, partial [Balneolaceae bacterium]
FTSFFNIQYRMQSDLAEVISEVFYEGRLQSAPEMEVKQEYREDLDSSPDNMVAQKKKSGRVKSSAKSRVKSSAKSSAKSSEKGRGKAGAQARPAEDKTPGPSSVTLLDSSPMRPVLTQDNRRRGFQPVNEVHLALLTDLIRELLTVRRVMLRDIGIIVPFRSTVWHLRRELRGKHRWYDLEVGTIHTFQGREKKVIILDTVMSGEARGGAVQHYSVRPFDEAKNGLSVPRLLNVAFSRSREQLVVVADMEHIRRVYGRKFLGKLLEKLPLR